MQRTRLITTINSIETPATGVWPLGVVPAVTVGRQRARAVVGVLTIGDAPLDVRITLSMETPDGTPIAIAAHLVDSDSSGRWTLDGDVRIGERTGPVTITARYHGVFQRGSHAWAEMSIRGQLGRRLELEAEVIFDSPFEYSEDAA